MSSGLGITSCPSGVTIQVQGLLADFLIEHKIASNSQENHEKQERNVSYVIISNEMIMNLIHLWDIISPGISRIMWYKKLSLCYVNLFMLFHQSNHFEFQKNLINSFCNPNVKHSSIIHQISLIKIIFNLLTNEIEPIGSFSVISNKFKSDLPEDHMYLVNECFKSFLFLLNKLNDHKEDLFNTCQFFDFFEAFYKQNSSLDSINTICKYYRLTIALLIKKGCQKLALKLFHRFLTFNASNKIDVTDQYLNLLRQTLEQFIIMILDFATLEDLFDTYHHIHNIFKNNNYLLSKLNENSHFLKILAGILDLDINSSMSLDSFNSLFDDITVLASRYLAFKIILLCKSIISGDQNINGHITNYYFKITFKKILSHIEEFNLDHNNVLQKAVFFLNRCYGQACFVMNNCQEILEVSIMSIIPFYFDLQTNKSSTLFVKNIKSLGKYVNKIGQQLTDV